MGKSTIDGRSRIEFANTLRGLASVSVLLYHYCWAFWSLRDAVSILTNLPVLPIDRFPIPYYFEYWRLPVPFNLGTYGVGLFFLISGFLIPFSVHKNSRFSFGLQRIFRIVPIYVVGLTISLVAIGLGGWSFGRVLPFSPLEIMIHYVPSLRDLLGSRILDGIVWTLEIEIKFYLICAGAMGWFRQNSNRVFWIPISLFLLSCFLQRQAETFGLISSSLYEKVNGFVYYSNFIVFIFVGVSFNYLYRHLLSLQQFFGLTLGLMAMFCLTWLNGFHQGLFYLMWSYVLALLTFSFAYFYPRFFKSNPIADFFAQISYPLYVIHGVAGYSALRILLERGVKTWISLILVTLSVLFLSWLLHRSIEKPLQNLGKKLAQRWTSTQI